MEHLKNKSIVSKQINLGDTRWREDILLFCTEFKKINCIPIRRLHFDGQKKNVYTWTLSLIGSQVVHGHEETSSQIWKQLDARPSMVKDPCRDQWKKRRLSTSCDESSDHATTSIATEQPSHSFTSPIQTKTGWRKAESRTSAMGMESLEKFTILVLTSFIFDRVARVIDMVGFSKKWKEHQCVFFWRKITRLSLTGNVDSFVSDGRCKHYTHFARLHTRKFFSCVWLKFWRDSSVRIVAFLYESS